MSALTRAFPHVEPIAGPFARLAAQVADWRQKRRARLQLRRAHEEAYRQIVWELSGCTDRQLADIGIPRFCINEVAREHAEMHFPLNKTR